MLEEYLQRDDVKELVKQLKTSECYYQKSNCGIHNHSLCVSNELALYTFYDALIKFKVIIDDEDYFADYLEQIERLYRKFESFNDVRYGIHKVIAKTAASKYELHECRGEQQQELIRVVYDKYIENGYYYHGFHSVYRSMIEKNGFAPEFYDNYYNRFLKVNGIFKKYKIFSILHKDFMGTEVSFTDDALLGCYYSMYAPMFFTEFMMNSIYGKKVSMEAYLKGDFDASVQPLKKFMSLHSFSEVDKQFVLDLVKDEWNLLHSEKQELCLLMIPRKQLKKQEVSVDEYLKLDDDVFDIIDRMLSSKCNSISSNDVLSKNEVEILSFPNYYEEKVEKALIIDPEKEYDSSKEKHFNGLLSNAYGHASILLLAGSLSISFGVILSILTVLGG